LKILHDCLAKQRSADAKQIVVCLEDGDFDTPLGRIQFGHGHNGNVPLILKTIRDGAISVLGEQ